MQFIQPILGTMHTLTLDVRGNILKYNNKSALNNTKIKRNLSKYIYLFVHWESFSLCAAGAVAAAAATTSSTPSHNLWILYLFGHI